MKMESVTNRKIITIGLIETKQMAKQKAEGKQTLKEALSMLEKKHGIGTVMQLAKGQKLAKVDVLKTGVWSIDNALGGGFVRGRIVELYGNEASGKTTLALQTVVQAQKAGGKAAYIDVEHAFSLEYAQSLGVNLQDLFFSQPDSAEAALDVAKTLASTGEFAVIVLDSVAALTPMSEFDGEVGKSQMGNLARFMSSALKQIIGEFSRTDTTFILINQLRTKIGIAYGNPEYTTGGSALKYYASQRLAIRRSSKIDDKAGNVIGYNTMIRVEKNKIALPHQKTEVVFINGKGFDAVADLFYSGFKMGIINKEKVTYWFGKEKLGVGEAASKEFIASNLEIQKQLQDRLAVVVPVVAAPELTETEEIDA
jgi:recombination protein RecA